MKTILKIFGALIVIILVLRVIVHLVIPVTTIQNYTPGTLYTSPENDFSVIFPGKPKQLSLGDGGVWLVESDSIDYVITRIKSNEDLLKDGSATGSANNFKNAELTYFKTEGGFKVYNTTFFDTVIERYEVGKMYLSEDNKKMYVVTVNYKPGTKLIPEMQSFLDSFKLN